MTSHDHKGDSLVMVTMTLGINVCPCPYRPTAVKC